jgi:MscS family membrane protein
VEQLKTIRNEIELYINKSNDFDVSIGVAVRIDKFSDSSIDMYVRCFTKTNSWNEMLSVKERLAIEIKQIVENNKAAFAFPSQSIYIEKK